MSAHSVYARLIRISHPQLTEDEVEDRAHAAAVDDALYQLDYVRKFHTEFGVRHNYNTHIDLKFLFWPAGIAPN